MDPNDAPDQPSDADTATLLQKYLTGAGGRAADATAAATADRMSNPLDPNLRNAEHALFSQSIIDRLGPVAGRAVVGAAVPAYTGAKAVAQALPAPVGQAIDRVSPFPLAGATKPDMSEVKWGLRPVWGSVAPAESTDSPYDQLLRFLGVTK